MVYYFTSRCGEYTIYVGKDKYENEDLIKYGLSEDVSDGIMKEGLRFFSGSQLWCWCWWEEIRLLHKDYKSHV